MGVIQSKEIQKNEILSCEAEINNLWGELNTANIPHATRVEIESKLSGCEEQFKSVLGGQASLKELKASLHETNWQLAFAAITQAENEISKREHEGGPFQGLENVRRDLTEGKISPMHARHEVKNIMRQHG